MSRLAELIETMGLDPRGALVLKRDNAQLAKEQVRAQLAELSSGGTVRTRDTTDAEVKLSRELESAVVTGILCTTAIAKIDSRPDLYGTCGRCKEPIGLTDLAEEPERVTCRACHESLERRASTSVLPSGVFTLAYAL